MLVARVGCLESTFVSLLVLFVSSSCFLSSIASSATQSKVLGLRWHLDTSSFFLIVLVGLNLWSCLLRIRALNPVAEGGLSSLLMGLAAVRVAFFLQSSWLKFYIYFELSLIPIFLILLGWGYQIERVRAAKAIILYTVRASLPLLLLFIAFSRVGGDAIYQASRWVKSSFFLRAAYILAGLAFLVKLPIMFFHIWLPKAHVEAPVIGSIFLAAVLLKLGGFGLIKTKPFFELFRVWGAICYSVSLWAVVAVRALCCQTTDIKVLIAFSSVSHMAVVVITLLTLRNTRSSAMVLILIAHGISSSIAFFFRFLFYKTSHTRNILLTKGALVRRGRALVLWGVCCIGVMGAPPTFNLWVEIRAYTRVVILAPVTTKFLFWGALLTGAYSFILASAPISANTQFMFTNKSLTKKIDIAHLVFSRGLIVGFVIVRARVFV